VKPGRALHCSSQPEGQVPPRRRNSPCAASVVRGLCSTPARRVLYHANRHSHTTTKLPGRLPKCSASDHTIVNARNLPDRTLTCLEPPASSLGATQSLPAPRSLGSPKVRRWNPFVRAKQRSDFCRRLCCLGQQALLKHGPQQLRPVAHPPGAR